MIKFQEWLTKRMNEVATTTSAVASFARPVAMVRRDDKLKPIIFKRKKKNDSR